MEDEAGNITANRTGREISDLRVQLRREIQARQAVDTRMAYLEGFFGVGLDKRPRFPGSDIGPSSLSPTLGGDFDERMARQRRFLAVSALVVLALSILIWFGL